jgi:hypothetical protein
MPISRPRRVAILNGFGMTLGDGVIGLTALAAALAAGRFAGRRPLLVRKPLFGRRLVNAVHEAAASLADVTWFPYRAASPPPFETRIDIREFAFDPDFRATSMVDYFLTRLGLEPDAVPASGKRNTWLAAALRPRRPMGLPEKYVLVCPRAAMAMRTMPSPVHARLLAALLALQSLPIVTQGSPAEPHPRIIHYPAVSSLAELAGLVAGAVLVVSTDTAMVHLADAWSVPTLAFFVTHRPEWRVRDYPFCTAIHLPALLPPALEFARDAADIAAAESAWTTNGPDLPWLEPALAAACAGGTA